MSAPDDRLEAERAAVKAAHASAEIYASPLDKERSLARIIGRTLLRLTFLWLLLSALAVAAVFLLHYLR